MIRTLSVYSGFFNYRTTRQFFVGNGFADHFQKLRLNAVAGIMLTAAFV